MITGPKSDFEARCVERGYTIDEVRACIVSEDGWLITVDENHDSYPRSKKTPFIPPPPPYLPPWEEASSTQPPEQLTLLEKAKNFAVASAKHVAAGMPMCSEDEIIRRHDICLGCEFFSENSCTKCGCPVVRDKKFISKLAWADQSCPVGKWGPT
jgi:hypothetical protein